MEQDTENEQQDPQAVCTCNGECQCEGECLCGNKYRRPVYYEVDVNQFINSLNDWD